MQSPAKVPLRPPAQPASSLTDDYARQIGRAISTGRPPSFRDDLDHYCESSPHEISAALAGVAQHMPPAGEDEELALGYLFLLQRLLEHVRYRADSGYADAVQLIADFQADVVARADAGDINGRALALIGGTLHQSKIPASPELVAASARLGMDQDEGEMLPADVRNALGEIFAACGGDPFMAADMLFESSHAMPADARSGLAVEMALAGIPEARSTVVLLLLDPDPSVRSTVAGALGQVAASLTPADVRRLIAMRNWRPEGERAAVDAVIRKARTAGIACAQWDAGSAETVMATSIDGSAAQGFLLVSPAEGKKKRLSSLLTRNVIVDATTSGPESPGKTAKYLASLETEAPTLPVPRAYLDRVVAHHLALTMAKGEVPPPGLLQVAEAIGGADWQPVRMDLGRELAAMIADVPKRMRDPASRASVLRKSGELAGLRPVALSWYEDDPEVAQAMAGAHVRRARLASYLLQSVIARRRDRWTEIFVRTAVWMREAGLDGASGWRDLALVAKALRDGQDMTEIGLMHDIALRTIKVLRATGRA